MPGKAIHSVLVQRDPLAVSLEHPRIVIHDSDSEPWLRHIAIGRNSWMVLARPRAGEVAGRFYSLVPSCKHAGADPEAYLEEVLVRGSTTPAREMASLTPWAWAAARAAWLARGDSGLPRQSSRSRLVLSPEDYSRNGGEGC